MIAFEEEVVRRARRRICRCARPRPPFIRAGMPFDPYDPIDVEVWIKRRLKQREWSGRETIAYVVRWIVWQALKSCRRKTLQWQSLDAGDFGSKYAHCGKSGGLRIAARKAPNEFDGEPVEELAACAMTAIRSSFGLEEPTERTAMAALSCIARTAHAVSSVSSAAAIAFTNAVYSHSVYRRLPLTRKSREKFELALRRLRFTGNARNDLKKTGLPCSGNEQWTSYRQVLMVEVRNRLFVK